MAKGIYVGVGGVARKVRNIFVGVGGVARKVKAVYISVAGVIRKVFSTEIVYLGEGIISLPYYANGNAFSCSGGETPSYAIIFRGDQDIADAYNASLVRFNATTILGTRTYATPDCTTLGNYLICAGGNGGSWGYGVKEAFALSDSLVLTTLTSLTNGQFGASTFTLSGLAIFAGGYSYDALYYKTVYTYNASLVKGSLPDLISGAKYSPSGSVANNIAIIVTGSYVYTYNASLVRSDVLDYTIAYNNSTAYHATTSKHLIIGGGRLVGTGETTDKVLAFDSSGVRATTTPLPSGAYSAGYKSGNTTVSDTAIFPIKFTLNSVDYVVSYDTSLVQKILPNFTTPRYGFGGAHVGDYALFAGSGDNSGAITQIIDVYKG